MNNRKVFLCEFEEAAHVPVDRILEAGWDIYKAGTIDQIKELTLENKDGVVGLMVLPKCNESLLENIEKVFLANRYIEWIALLQSDDLKDSLLGKFVAQNFHDYHTLPIDFPRLLVTLGRAYGKGKLKSRFRENYERKGGCQIMGKSPVMQELFSKLAKVQNVDSPVLVLGESGTGKELVARAIHEHSARGQEPFVAVNCGALPTHLIQSELFGHEKGAFTGALQRKIGRIESASGGTVFLDEIGDLPLDLQGNLLRFLQEKTIERVGSNQSIGVDVRVIAATHVDLESAVAQGRFRQDLYYRLKVLSLKMPPLRERGDDIELLALTFFEKFSKEQYTKAKGFSRQALRVMRAYNWPGNVRELINRVQSAVIMSENRLITPADLDLERRSCERVKMSLEDARQKAEFETIQLCLKINDNNVSKTARNLGVSRVTLYRLMNKFNII